MEYGKYIIVSEGGHKLPILFSGSISHDVFLQCYHKSRILSAGFFVITASQIDRHLQVNVWGYSQTLKIFSDENDFSIIERFITKGR